MSKQANKKVIKEISLQIEAGKANPAPPVGPALGTAGVNIMAFCNEFNDRTKSKAGNIFPVVISVYSDRSFSFIIKKPPVARMILKALGIEKGSSVPNREKAGELTQKQVEEIAREKMEDLNARDLQAAKKLVAGTAQSMGVTVQNDAAPAA